MSFLLARGCGLILEELAEPIKIKDGDCDVIVSKQRAFIQTLVAAAIGGNTRACGALLTLCAKLGADSEDEELAPDDREILAAFSAHEGKQHHGRE